MEPPQLSNIREHCGWLIGRTIVDVTAGDPPAFPDHDPVDAWDIVLHLDNGGYVRVHVETKGLGLSNPDEPDEPGQPDAAPDPLA